MKNLGNFRYLRTIWRLRIKPKPRVLYKYHALNDYFEDLLQNETLWSCTSLDLNDPYDSRFDTTAAFLQHKYLDSIHLEDLSVSDFSLENFNKLKILIAQEISCNHPDFFANMYRKQVGVCCFTTNPLSELMWSHYADSAKGACLEFSFGDDLEFSSKILPVEYSDKLIKVKNDVDRAKALLRKRKVWKYENEWRIFSDPGQLKFNKTHLKGIIFGPRTSMTCIRRIKEILDKKQYSLKISFCDYTSSGLSIVNIDNNLQSMLERCK